MSRKSIQMQDNHNTGQGENIVLAELTWPELQKLYKKEFPNDSLYSKKRPTIETELRDVHGYS